MTVRVYELDSNIASHIITWLIEGIESIFNDIVSSNFDLVRRIIIMAHFLFNLLDQISKNLGTNRKGVALRTVL